MTGEKVQELNNRSFAFNWSRHNRHRQSDSEFIGSTPHHDNDIIN